MIYPLFNLVTLTFLSKTLYVDSARFSSLETTVNGNKSGSTTLMWQYELTGSDLPKTMKLECGRAPLVTAKAYIRKEGDEGRVQVLNNRVSADTTGSTQQTRKVGMRFNNIREDDAGDYICRLLYNDGVQVSIREIFSQSIKLIVLTPPRFINCLDNWPQDIRAGQNLQVRCSFFGVPLPEITCTLIKYDGTIIPGQKIVSQNNLTANSGDSFNQLPMDATKVKCVASHYTKKTGTVERIADIPQFRHKPFKVGYLYAGPDREFSNRLKVQFRPLLSNETGINQLQNYVIGYYLTKKGVVNETQKTVDSSLPRQGELYKTVYIDQYIPDRQYTVWVAGRNLDGLGEQQQTIIVTSGARTAEKNHTGAIAGGVIGGIILIILIIVLAMYLLRKKPKNDHYPTNYIEDAVEYKPGLAGSTGGTYASVNRPAKAKPVNDDTSGYPDVVNNGREKPKNYNNRGYDQKREKSYEESPSGFV